TRCHTTSCAERTGAVPTCSEPNRTCPTGPDHRMGIGGLEQNGWMGRLRSEPGRMYIAGSPSLPDAACFALPRSSCWLPACSPAPGPPARTTAGRALRPHLAISAATAGEAESESTRPPEDHDPDAVRSRHDESATRRVVSARRNVDVHQGRLDRGGRPANHLATPPPAILTSAERISRCGLHRARGGSRASRPDADCEAHSAPLHSSSTGRNVLKVRRDGELRVAAATRTSDSDASKT